MLNKLSNSKKGSGAIMFIIELLVLVAFLPVIISANQTLLSSGSKVMLALVDLIVVAVVIITFLKKNEVSV
jgi:hypothetical protein